MSIKSKIQALISAANTKTGESDTTLTDAVQTLVDGYGQGGGGIEKAEGDFTIVSAPTSGSDNAPTLSHNLNTQKIAVLIYPTSKIIGTAGYQNFYAFFINVSAFLLGQTWTFDWTSYNSHFTADETVTIPSSKLREGIVHVSPWTTQSNWYTGGNPDSITNEIVSEEKRVAVTDNTVRVRGAGRNFTWAQGSYHWIVWKLG